jgi:hypothetical protein
MSEVCLLAHGRIQGVRLTGSNILFVRLLGGDEMCDFTVHIFGIASPVGPYPLGDLVAIPFEAANGAPVYLLECLAHGCCQVVVLVKREKGYSSAIVWI